MAIAIGTMSGTSMDGVDVALIETDGESVSRFGAYLSREYSPTERHILRGAVNAARDLTDRTVRPGPIAEAQTLVTETHLRTIDALIQQEGIHHHEVDVVGFHGQTILHRPERRLTVQIGDGVSLARRLKIPVVYDFRAADVASGGQGAPLVPVYHRALLRAFADDGPIVVVNIGGVANVTYIDGEAEPVAFDTGPGNAPIDELMLTRSGKPMDEGGVVAASGTADAKLVAAALTHKFFALRPPKSLDRADFARFDFAGLSLPDAVATAAEIVVSSIALSRDHFPKAPKRWIIAGGGARNPTLVKLLKEKLSPARVQTAEEIGWQSGAVEAQAFAFLAVRSMKGLPLSFPKTTGVAQPMTGGVLVRP
ncbi:MAG: anhydro-N-acetylmuramic acid kinase [Xanthobacteraceae bacterium]|nr:anhydro-N-acetylmuramic acid kinase [Xanthobacteraceae bacterium]MBX3534089.1 anhydro-N-acetylmuramic acid kinase [Xanthobacteraceae bacterium]MCW5678772.1 anhydro-N-acetylmuramic acid kinase [Xanthobacteraceae bacterium]